MTFAPNYLGRGGKIRQTAARNIGKSNLREGLRACGSIFEKADVIDVDDWLVHLGERFTKVSIVGKGEAALVATFEGINKLIQAGRIEGGKESGTLRNSCRKGRLRSVGFAHLQKSKNFI